MHKEKRTRAYRFSASKAKYFSKEDWTTQINLNLFMKSEFSRRLVFRY